MDARNDSFDAILARTRERARREKLHREIGALERKLERIGANPQGLRHERAWRLNSKIKRLRAKLLQPELML